MRDLIILLLLVLSMNNLWAISTKDCTDQGEAFSSHSKINPLCFYQFKKYATDYQKLTKNGYEVIGRNNIIFVKNKSGQINSIAGDKTSFSNVLFIDFNLSNNKLYVLNINKKLKKQILIFRLNTNGNVVPTNVFDLDEISSIDSFLIHNEKIWFIDSMKKSLVAFDENLDSRSHLPDKKVIAEQEYKAIESIKWSLNDIIFFEDHIINLDRNNKRALIYKMRRVDNKTNFALIDLEINFPNEGPSSISIIKENDEYMVKISNFNGHVLIPTSKLGDYEYMEKQNRPSVDQ